MSEAAMEGVQEVTNGVGEGTPAEKKENLVKPMEDQASDTTPKEGPAGDSELNKLLADPVALAKAKADVDSQPSFLHSLPKEVQGRVRALKALQLGAVKEEESFYREVHRIECAFSDKLKDFYQKRQDIISGAYEPTDEEKNFPLNGVPDKTKTEEMQNGEESEEKKENGKPERMEEGAEAEKENVPNGDDKEGQDKEIKGVPNFWLTVFKGSDIMHSMIEEHDEPILAHLRDVEVKIIEEPMGFDVLFHFEPNEYFSNSTLTKHYSLRCDVASLSDPFEFDGPEIKSCQGEPIDWKNGKNVTERQMKKKQRNAGGQIRYVTEKVPCDSFFNFFNPPTEGDKSVQGAENALLADYDIGQHLRDRLVPRATLYYTGEMDDGLHEDEDEDESFNSNDLSTESSDNNPSDPDGSASC